MMLPVLGSFTMSEIPVSAHSVSEFLFNVVVWCHARGELGRGHCNFKYLNFRGCWFGLCSN